MITRRAQCVNAMREAARAFWYDEIQRMNLDYDEVILITTSSSLFGQGMKEKTEAGLYRSVDSGHLHIQKGRVSTGVPLYYVTDVNRISESKTALEVLAEFHGSFPL